MDFDEAKQILAALEQQGHVATPLMLYKMKRDTVRPQDRVDAEALRQRFGLEED